MTAATATLDEKRATLRLDEIAAAVAALGGSDHDRNPKPPLCERRRVMTDEHQPKWAVRVDDSEAICAFDDDKEMEDYARDTARQLPGMKIGIYRLDRIAIASVGKPKITSV